MKITITLLFICLTTFSSEANIYTVTDTTASSPFSLANAIIQANANPGADTIEFNISGIQNHYIASDSLDDITDTVFINGLSQPGNIATEFSNTTLLIRGAKGLSIHSAGCSLVGIGFHNYATSITAITIVADSGKSISHTLIKRVFIEGGVGSYGIIIYTDTLYGLSSNDLIIDSSKVDVEGGGIIITSSVVADLTDIFITNNELYSGYIDFGAVYETSALSILRKSPSPANPNIRITDNNILCHIDLQGYLDGIYIADNAIHSSAFTLTDCSINNAIIEHNDISDGPGSMTGLGSPFIQDFLSDTIRNISIQDNNFDATSPKFSFNGNNQYFDSIIFSGNVLSASQVSFYKSDVNNPDSQFVNNLIVKNNSNGDILYPFSMVFQFSGRSVFSNMTIENNTLNTYFCFLELVTNSSARIRSISIVDNHLSCDQVGMLLRIQNDGVTDTLFISNNSFNAINTSSYVVGLLLGGNGIISNLKINNNYFSIAGLHDNWSGGTCGIVLGEIHASGEINGNTFTNCTDEGIYISTLDDSATVLTISANTIYGSYNYGIAVSSLPYNPPSQNIGQYTITANSIYSIGNEGIYRASQHDTASCMTCIPKPILLNAEYYNGITTVNGMFTGDTTTNYFIEFFSNIFPDTGGYTEGHTFIYRDTVTTDLTGNCIFSIDIQGNFMPYILTSTATSMVTYQTSEFSNETGVVLGSHELKNENGIIVFPNPVSDIVSVYSTEYISGLELIDLLGHRIHFQNTDPHLISIDIKNFYSGIYFLEIQSGYKTIIKKILKN